MDEIEIKITEIENSNLFTLPTEFVVNRTRFLALLYLDRYKTVPNIWKWFDDHGPGVSFSAKEDEWFLSSDGKYISCFRPCKMKWEEKVYEFEEFVKRFLFI